MINGFLAFANYLSLEWFESSSNQIIIFTARSLNPENVYDLCKYFEKILLLQRTFYKPDIVNPYSPGTIDDEIQFYIVWLLPLLE